MIKSCKKLLIITGALLFCLKINASPQLEAEIAAIPQDLTHYVAQLAVNTQSKTERQADYIDAVTSPWHSPFNTHSADDVKVMWQQLADKMLSTPYWGINLQPVEQEWLQLIIDNMDLVHLPNAGQTAITVTETNLRVLPTQSPLYADPSKAGEGPPFDYGQNSYLYFNTPVYLLHTSLDKVWHLVMVGDNSIGWVPASSIVTVSRKIRLNYTSDTYVTPTQNEMSLQDRDDNTIGKLRLGQTVPLTRELENSYVIKVIVNNSQGNGKIKNITLAKSTLAAFPLEYNATSIATIGNLLNGIPYGWGGLSGYLDCSQLLRDLFAAHGVWLPRNSKDQMGDDYVDVSSLNNNDKSFMIKANAIPFHTLIYMPGHIGLYIGHDDDHIYMFHTPWGLRTWDEQTGTEGRDIIGRAVITSLDLGSNISAISATWLTKTTRFRVLLD